MEKFKKQNPRAKRRGKYSTFNAQHSMIAGAGLVTFRFGGQMAGDGVNWRLVIY
jgi:hypothetical protein